MLKLLPIFISLSFAAAAFAASVNGPTFGSYAVQCPADSDTYIGILPTRMPAFTGEVDGMTLSSRKISARGEPKWEADKFVYQKGVQTNHYYLKFTSGELEGAWFDIFANDSYSVQISIGEAEFRKISVGDAFQIIPHWTMATLFPDGGGFAKATSMIGATLIRKQTEFDSENGSVYPIGKNKAFLSTYYFKKSSSSAGWKTTRNAAADDSVVEPNTGLKIIQPDSGTVAIVSGVIPLCASSFELFVAEDTGSQVQSQDIMLAIPSAVDIKLSDLTDALVGTGAFAASSGFVPTDILRVYDNSKTGKNVSATKSFYFKKSSGRWVDMGDYKADVEGFLLKPEYVLKFIKQAEGSAMAVRVKVKHKYDVE